MLILFLGGCNLSKPKVYRVGVLSGLNFIADITDGLSPGWLNWVRGGENIVMTCRRRTLIWRLYQTILGQFVEDGCLNLVFPTEASMEAKAATQGTDSPRSCLVVTLIEAWAG
jgi:hypothetical protein